MVQNLKKEGNLLHRVDIINLLAPSFDASTGEIFSLYNLCHGVKVQLLCLVP